MKIRPFAIIFTLLVCVFAAPASPLSEGRRHERLVQIIKRYETLHSNAGNYVGYGHAILPGEPFHPNETLSLWRADSLLRADLDKLYAIFARYGESAYLLTALAYNVGIGKVLGGGGYSKSELLRQLESGNRDLRNYYLRFCRVNGRPHKMLLTRRIVEYALLWED